MKTQLPIPLINKTPLTLPIKPDGQRSKHGTRLKARNGVIKFLVLREIVLFQSKKITVNVNRIAKRLNMRRQPIRSCFRRCRALGLIKPHVSERFFDDCFLSYTITKKGRDRLAGYTDRVKAGCEVMLNKPAVKCDIWYYDKENVKHYLAQKPEKTVRAVVPAQKSEPVSERT